MSAAIREVFTCIRQVAGTDLSVLIQESGTGKELIARASTTWRPAPGRGAHRGQRRSTAGDPHRERAVRLRERGVQRRLCAEAGLVRDGERGTLFLDEIGEMAPKTQVDMLRVLEQHEVRRLGGEALIPLDVRLVAATHRNIEELVAEGRLRADLYYRLNVMPIRLPRSANGATTSPSSSLISSTRPACAHRTEAQDGGRRSDAYPVRLLMAGEYPPVAQRYGAARRNRGRLRDPLQ